MDALDEALMDLERRGVISKNPADDAYQLRLSK
jgi:hypothetical protein